MLLNFSPNDVEKTKIKMAPVQKNIISDDDDDDTKRLRVGYFKNSFSNGNCCHRSDNKQDSLIEMQNQRLCNKISDDCEKKCLTKSCCWCCKTTTTVQRNFRKNVFMQQKMLCFIVVSFCILVPISYGQLVTRDPRFYSREGDFNYKWPNPGDPEYR